MCIGQVFSIRYDTIHLVAISDILDEQFKHVREKDQKRRRTVKAHL